MTRLTKLELTWVGKDERPRLEPRILLEEPALSHHATANVTGRYLFDNRLIQGDNLLAIKALEQEFAGGSSACSSTRRTTRGARSRTTTTGWSTRSGYR